MNYMLQAASNTLLLSIPQSVICLAFSFQFWGMRLELYWRKVLLLGVLHSLYLNALMPITPLPVHFLNALISFAALFFLLFRTIGLQMKLMIQITFYLIVIISDTSAIWMGSGLLGLERMADASLADRMLLCWPLVAAIAALCWLLYDRSCYPGQRIRRFLTSRHHRPMFLFIVLIFIQTVIMVAYFFSRFFTRYDEMSKMLFYIGLAATLFVSFAAISLLIRTREEAIRMTRSAYVSDVMQMLTSIRGQRHDFLNHIQVISSMLTMKKYDQLKSYIEEIAIDLQAQNSRNGPLPGAAVAALVQSKQVAADARQICFNHEIPAKLAMSHLRNTDLIRILGNLIDNAFDEAATLPAGERFTNLALRQQEQRLEIEVMNSGRLLSEEERQMMLTPGYSTKDNHHSGLGLAIVSDLVSRYNGTLSVDSDPQGIIIRAVLHDQPPKQEALL